MDDEFEALRRETDPLVRGRRATELLGVYQQRSAELARIRRVAIDDARDRLGIPYNKVADMFGVSKGRITQIRSTAPPPHRALFGVGPLDLRLPGRQSAVREELVLSTDDDTVGRMLTDEAERLAFTVDRDVLDPRQEWEPTRDAIVVCGPASAHVGQMLMADDPLIGMSLGDGTSWVVVDKVTGDTYRSPLDEPEPSRADHAYIARHALDGRTVVHIAGLHTLGSIGAARYLIDNLPELWAELGDTSWSMAVTAEFDASTPTSVTVLIPPRRWDE